MKASCVSQIYAEVNPLHVFKLDFENMAHKVEEEGEFSRCRAGYLFPK